MNKEYQVELSDKDRSQLRGMKVTERVRKVKRAHILLQADMGKKDKEIAAQVGVAVPTVRRIRRQYVTAGLEAALNEKPRSGRPPGISAETRAKVTALACTEAPEGRGRWTLRLLADKVVELQYIESISHHSVLNILKKTN